MATRTVKTPIPSDLRWKVWARDNYTCLECGSRVGLSIDHVVPESVGGETVLANLQTLCGSCTRRKWRHLPTRVAHNHDDDPVGMDGWRFDRAKLRNERTRRAMTQAELAAASGLNDVTVCRLETGARASPRPPTIRKLADALGIKPERLMTLDRRKPARPAPAGEE